MLRTQSDHFYRECDVCGKAISKGELVITLEICRDKGSAYLDVTTPSLDICSILCLNSKGLNLLLEAKIIPEASSKLDKLPSSPLNCS